MKRDSLQVSRVIMYIVIGVVVAACSGGSHSDLDEYMAEVRQRPVRDIEPLPTLTRHETFTYSAMQSRSPFEKPVETPALAPVKASGSNVKPPEDHPPELLENFALGALTMVGTLQRDGNIWALIDDGAGSIHRVTVGNYMGRNWGRITAISEIQLELIEIVPDGTGDGWVERLKTMRLRESEE
jgi:type IV pilus assembly protein PilP